MALYWKTIVLVVGAIGVAWMIVMPWLADAKEKRWLTSIAIAAAGCVAISFTSVPYLIAVPLFGVVIAALLAQRIPAAAVLILMVALLPSAEMPITNVAGVGVLFILSVPLFASLALLVTAGVRQPAKLPFELTGAGLISIVFLAIYSWLEMRGSPVTTIARVVAQRVITFGVPCLILSQYRTERPEFLIKALFFATIAASLIMVVEIVRVLPIYRGVIELRGGELSTDWGMLMRSGRFRALGPFRHALEASIFMGVAITMAAAMWMAGRRSPWVLLSALFAIAGLATTGSRSGMLAAGTGLLVLFVIRRNFAMAAVTLVAGYGVSKIYAMNATADQIANSEYRLNMLLNMPPLLKGHFLLGNNQAIASGLFDDFIQGEGIVDFVNAYLGILAIGGMLSLGLFLASIGAMAWSWKRLKAAQPTPDELMLGQALIASIGAIAMALTVSSGFSDAFLLMFVLGGVLVGLRRQAESAMRARRRAAARAVREDRGLADPANPGDRVGGFVAVRQG